MTFWNSEKATNLTALYTLIVMLPFVHLYAYQTAVGRLPFVSGLIPILTLIGFLLLIRFSVKSPALHQRIGWSAVLFLAYLAVHVLVKHSAGTVIGRDIDGSLLSNNLLIVYKTLIFLVVGLNLSDPLAYRRSVVCVWTLMVLSALSNVGSGTLLLDLEGAEDGAVGLYLFLGDSFAIWSLLSVFCVKSFILRFGIIVLSLVTLFVLTSRTSLYAFAFSQFIVLLLFIVREKKLAFKRVFIGVFWVAILSSLLSSFINLEEVLEGRMLRLFSEGEDDSWSFRQWQLDVGIQHILESPFWGNYGSQVRLLGRMGDYIHSYLEVWRQFGIVPFLWIVGLVLTSIYIGGKFAWREMSDRSLFILGLLVFTVLEITMARSWGNPYIFLAIGLCAGVAAENRRLISRRRAARA
ncbi:MAG: O-antigen ligase domain-containing protein [Candidatus Moraniibacteriota bacterium]|nr:MAG: O-antigen ligase domain-containing protein [Candidatus Moranbacteria bacterium]